ncbi:MAG: ABC transporter permease [Candidatus Bipolaricaulota bacterium]|nr:ABC transporter permease [Candidatus Bipolaricaulota bacterium]
MFGYLTRKFTALVLTLILVSLAIFLVLRFLPGDPAQLVLGINASPESLAQLRSELGLNEPLHVQYLNWMKGLLTGNLGDSIFYEKSVGSLIASRLAVTLPLTFLATLLSIIIALPLGILAAINHRQPGDFGIIVFSQLGISVPAFWLGILGLLLFSVKLNLLPSGGFIEWGANPLGAIRSLTLPVVTLAIIQSAALTRMTRSSALDVLSQDYVTAARGRGLPEVRVLSKHVLSNSLISIITLIGLQVGQLLAGAVIVESVFHLPGLGRLLILAVEQRDLQLVQGIVTILVGAIITINYLVDLTYGILDPRIRLT